MKLRLAIAIAFAALGPALAAHAAPRSYAVLSMVGDALTVVSYQPTTGRAGDPNRRDVLPMPEPVLDRDVLRTIDDLVRSSDRTATPVLLGLPVASVPKDQPALFDGNHFRPPEALAAALRACGATHLIVVTKQRAEANLQLRDGKLGAGKLEGLGFYIDWELPVRDGHTNEPGQGFIAPYAYLRTSLVDLATFEVLRERAFAETETFASSKHGGDSVNPWTALSSTEKVDAIERLLRHELRQAVPELLAP